MKVDFTVKILFSLICWVFRSTLSHLGGSGLGSLWPLVNFFLPLEHSLCVCSPSGHWDSGLASGFSQVPVAMPTGNWSPRMSNDVMWLCSKVPTKTLLPLQHLITHHCCQVLLILTCLHRGYLPSQRRCVCVSVCVWVQSCKHFEGYCWWKLVKKSHPQKFTLNSVDNFYTTMRVIFLILPVNQSGYLASSEASTITTANLLFVYTFAYSFHHENNPLAFI